MVQSSVGRICPDINSINTRLVSDQHHRGAFDTLISVSLLSALLRFRQVGRRFRFSSAQEQTLLLLLPPFASSSSSSPFSPQLVFRCCAATWLGSAEQTRKLPAPVGPAHQCKHNSMILYKVQSFCSEQGFFFPYGRLCGLFSLFIILSPVVGFFFSKTEKMCVEAYNFFLILVLDSMTTLYLKKKFKCFLIFVVVL